MNNKTNTLFLFTNEYPYGTGETFINNEIQYLSENFEKVYLIPVYCNNGKKRELPENIFVLNYKYKNKNVGKIDTLKYLFQIIRILFYQIIKSKNRLFYINNVRYLKNYIANKTIEANKIGSIIKQHSSKNGKNIIYSYWFEDVTIPLAILKQKKEISNLYVRAHGYDLFIEQIAGDYFIFRSYVLNNITKIFSVSKTGKNYMSEYYPGYTKKISFSYIGTQYSGINKINNKHTFTLVSCSSIIGVKRIHLIIEILKYIEFDIIWYHIGNGKLMESVQKLSADLPKNIKCNFSGHISNTELMKFYSDRAIDLFINTSYSEGIPVSIMEAISFGIPVIATNAGGTKEIVTKNTGFLIKQNFDTKEVAVIITEYQKRNYNEISKLRKSTHNFWKQNFDAENNYIKFVRNLQ